MIATGVQYMFVGMGVVFSFLTIMVLSMYAMSALIAIYTKRFPEAKQEVAGAVAGSSTQAEIAAVIAAVKHFS